MKKTNTQKGITLIALIITIIVLLILAVVAIGAVQNDGIIEHAKNARNEYQAAQRNEQTTLQNYLDKLEENKPSGETSTGGGATEGVVSGKGPWIQNGTTVTNGTITLNVSDVVEYKSNKLISVNSGEINQTNGENIMIDKKYEEDLGGGWKVLGAENGEVLLMSTTDITSLELYGEQYYDNDYGIDLMNEACEGYDQGEYATGVRSIKKEDISRLSEYDKTTTNPVYVMLFRNEDNTSNVSYWLGNSSYYELSEEYGGGYEKAIWCVYDDGRVTYVTMYATPIGGYGETHGVRAVVSLESDVVLTKNGTNSWTLSK